jgi:hypothetical protein
MPLFYGCRIEKQHAWASFANTSSELGILLFKEMLVRETFAGFCTLIFASKENYR